MEEKSQVKMDETRVHKSKLVGGSMLLLSVLLTAAVAALIYLAVLGKHESCLSANNGQQTTEEVNVEATVNVKTTKGEVKEKIEYSHAGHVAYMYGSDGSFNMRDMRKGIHLLRDHQDSICYLIPVGTNSTKDNNIEGVIAGWDGKDTEAHEETRSSEVLDGKITDVSFLSQKAQDECTSGYQWMVILNSENGDAADDGALSRQKRSHCCHNHYYFWLCGPNDEYVCYINIPDCDCAHL